MITKKTTKPTKKPARPKWLTPLKKSIAHWREVATATNLSEVGLGIADCALCQVYFVEDVDVGGVDRCCVGRPVREYTGKRYCKGTPYMLVYNARYRWVWSAQQPSSDAYAREIRRSEQQFYKAAKEMLAFLENLVPRAFRTKNLTARKN